MLRKTVIGRQEKVDFPLLQLFDVAVKIDTGAYTASLNCCSIREEAEGLYCVFLDATNPAFTAQEYLFKQYSLKWIKSSNGALQQRYKISTDLLIGGQIQSIECTLSNRSTMRYPVLLGRKFLKNKYLVDVSKTYTLLKRNHKR